MRIVKSLSLILLMTVALIGCSKDDNGKDVSASLVGTWKLTAATWNGQSDLEECDLKSTVVFTETTMTTTDYSGTDCMTSESFTVDYTRSGNTLKFSILGVEIDSSEITTLTASTLVVTDTDDGDVYVTTFARQ